MHIDLLSTKRFVFDVCDFTFTEFLEEKESLEYGACTFILNEKSIKFRAAKITPTKIGAFVTLWKRNAAGITQPHEDSDNFDLYVSCVRKDNFFEQFVFPKTVLIEQGILSSSKKGGKRGFRIYPPWNKTENKQAQKTQKWQLNFFLEINDGKLLDVERAKNLYSK